MGATRSDRIRTAKAVAQRFRPEALEENSASALVPMLRVGMQSRTLCVLWIGRGRQDDPPERQGRIPPQESSGINPVLPAQRGEA